MRKKIFYYSVISILSVLLVYFLYVTIGYFVLGSKAPTLQSQGTTAHFMGMYLMGITYGAIFLVLLVVLILLLIFRKKILRPSQKQTKNQSL